ncbi:hypothetical protein [Actinokineospora fastidiosa]|uniref:Uncharacterized protein n=1 Tax=Actinokineospora fastidiosa TaxID=1816 RepID=A0A918L9H4_9PSEU|nr:hypothetical protein [Actinokineospora fastidiosa]GGS22252.1 hypothetical protein GCM10010171_13850 [Actinokineospora fastidiosa]
MSEHPPQGDYDESGVPSLDYVRDKIEGRFATSTGATELAEAGHEAAEIDKRLAEREKAGADRLAEIRRAMRGE